MKQPPAREITGDVAVSSCTAVLTATGFAGDLSKQLCLRQPQWRPDDSEDAINIKS